VRVGLISDTHGLLRPEAEAALEGVERILHAGDVGRPEVLARLERLAPVTAVRGNVDAGGWAEALPETATLTLAGRRLHVLHDRAALALDPAAEGVAVVVSGHSHRPSITREAETLFVNPGAAGPRRFRLPVTLALLDLGDEAAEARLVRLLE
jgi:putative phosphoesterase